MFWPTTNYNMQQQLNNDTSHFQRPYETHTSHTHLSKLAVSQPKLF